MSIETAAGPLAPEKKKYLPNRILRAIDSTAELQGLTTGVRATLQAICRYVSQHDPLGAVFTRRAKIAARAGLSVRSIDRHLEKLSSLGLVRVEDQRHGQRNGKFLVTHIFLTDKLAQMVGLVDVSASLPPPSPAPLKRAQPSDKMTCGHINGLPVPSSTTKKQGRPQLSEPTIPEDLQPLVQLGLMPTTVCKLMREARENGKRLSDILVVVQERLRELKLKGGQIRNYLLKAIASPTDFSKRAEGERQNALQREKARADKEIVDRFQEQYRGKVLRSPDGRETLYINADGTLARHHQGLHESILPLQNRVDVAHVMGKLEAGQLCVAQTRPKNAQETPLRPVPLVTFNDTARQQIAAMLAVLKGGRKEIAPLL